MVIIGEKFHLFKSFYITFLLLVLSSSLLSPKSPSLEVFMCTRSTPGSITYEKCEDIHPVQYIKASSTGTFIFQKTLSMTLLSDIDGWRHQNQIPIRGKKCVC